MDEPSARDVYAFCHAGNFAAAASLVLSMHGGELMRFLMSRSGDPLLASEAFAVFSEDLVRGLPTFEFRASVRTWSYALAYHALVRLRRTARQESSRTVALSELTASALPAPQARTETPIYLRSEVKARFTALRQSLSREEQLVLDLRVTGRFSWIDIARICVGGAGVDAESMLTKEAARLRKRFQLAKAKLQQMAIAEGLLTAADRDE
jgi:RNA polymerase sigma-70 factor (ECF subfamily)